MADRKVTRSAKDSDGDITALCNTGQSWSPRQKRDAINDIENGIHSYFVEGSRGRVDIRVVNGQSGKYLRTDPDKTSKNNLDDLLIAEIA
ncbi:DUF3892 domain-containing protein [Blastopirellula marina]|uniref:DUF3892 domain-containing protein n=1 Tax=Blastopirellula marina DSM 3645 TaxID=314230 RepID=A3ZP14_9BACT|nr:DUF3892 domain-containing protein [Blastopirellula marina]EAQ81488.1 hypothetical protein DSM3645_27942 [Blastopirellula marina DSM 3645]